MIFVETSALVAILMGEMEASALSDKIQASKTRYTGAHCKLEACMVLSSRRNTTPSMALSVLNKMLQLNKITVMSLTDRISERAIEAFELYGKGRQNKAQLNLADCMSYGFAKSENLKMLYVGEDFRHTDIRSA